MKNELALPLSLLFRKSMDESRIPEDWRLSHVTPVYKKGSKAEAVNYRPVSLTSNVCKLMERVVNVSFSSFLNKHVLTCCLSCHKLPLPPSAVPLLATFCCHCCLLACCSW